MARPKGLCKEHFPDGWDGVPEENSGVGCEHGTWTRPGVGTAKDDDGDQGDGDTPPDA